MILAKKYAVRTRRLELPRSTVANRTGMPSKEHGATLAARRLPSPRSRAYLLLVLLLVAAALRDLPGPPRLLTARQQFPAQSYTKIAAPGLPIHRTASSSCAIHHCGDFGCCPAFSGLTSRRSEQIARPSKSTSADPVRLSFQPGRDQGSPHVTSQANPIVRALARLGPPLFLPVLAPACLLACPPPLPRPCRHPPVPCRRRRRHCAPPEPVPMPVPLPVLTPTLVPTLVPAPVPTLAPTPTLVPTPVPTRLVFH